MLHREQAKRCGIRASTAFNEMSAKGIATAKSERRTSTARPALETVLAVSGTSIRPSHSHPSPPRTIFPCAILSPDQFISFPLEGSSIGVVRTLLAREDETTGAESSERRARACGGAARRMEKRRVEEARGRGW